jgi:O-antigen ligase
LAWLPLNIDPEARLDAQASTEWRIEIWEALLPQVPKYLLLGKGYAFSVETFQQNMGRDATFQNFISAADNPLALSSDFHSGPLSVVLSFGIWGALAWLWFWAAGFYVVWRNYHYGDPAIRHLNLFLFAAFVSKCFSFLFIFGAISDDVTGFASIIGLSAALNNGVMRPKPQPKLVPAAPAKPSLAMPARPAFQR